MIYTEVSGCNDSHLVYAAESSNHDLIHADCPLEKNNQKR